MSRVRRKALSASFIAVACVLALASTAYACTVFKGQMKVRGLDVSGHETHEVRWVGNNTGMGYSCRTGHANANGANDAANDIYVEVSGYNDGTGGCADSKLPQNGSDGRVLDYDVTFIDKAFETTSSGTFFRKDCMAVGGDLGTKKIGDISIDSTGFGSGNYNIGSAIANQNKNPWQAGVCVSDTNYSPSLYGMQVALDIL